MRNKLEKLNDQLCTVSTDSVSLTGKLAWHPYGECHVSILPSEHYYARIQFLPESIESISDTDGYVINLKESQ